MAATGKTPILLYGSTTTSNVPAAGNLTNSSDGCEIAINVTDGYLFYKDNLNAIQKIGYKLVPIANGGTNNTAFTAKSGNVAGLVFFDGTKLANDATVTDVGYDTSTNTFQANAATIANNITTTSGNLVIGTSGKGIDFSATAGTGTSELLADYEEGTFTPTIFGTTNAGTGTYTTQAGFYTKIGNRVFFHLNMTWTAHTGTGNSRFGGLPYTSANIAFSGPNCTINPNNYALTANNVMIAVVNGNASTGSIYQMPTGGGAQAEVPLDTVAGVSITGFYQTS